MKRILLFAATVLLAVSCKKVTPGQQISKLSDYFGSHDNEFVAPLSQHEGDRRLDYLTLVLNRDLEAAEIWTLDTGGGTSLAAEFPGWKKDETDQIVLVSASLDDPTACAVALDMLGTFKRHRVRLSHTVRLLFYDNAPDSLGRPGLEAVNREFRASEELITFDLELSSSCDSIPSHTFILEEKPVFAKQIMEALPPYFQQLGNYKFVQGVYPNSAWPLKGSVYRYRIDPGDLPRETAAVAALTLLLN